MSSSFKFFSWEKLCLSKINILDLCWNFGCTMIIVYPKFINSELIKIEAICKIFTQNYMIIYV